MLEKLESYHLGKYVTEIEQHKNTGCFFVGFYVNNELITSKTVINHSDSQIVFSVYKALILILYKKDTKEL